MTDPSDAIYKAFYSQLNGITYSGSAVGCYTFAPGDKTKPYMILDNPVIEEVGTKDRAIFDITINVKVYDYSTSRVSTTNAVDDIGNSIINTILTTISERISVTGYDVIDVQLDNVIIPPAEINEKSIIRTKHIRFNLIMEA